MSSEMIDTLKNILRPARRLVFFGGAGVSTESGIPDFRSRDGLYNRKYDVPPEEILSHRYFLRHPDRFYAFYRDKMNCLAAAPNAAHRTLARWEAEGWLSGIVTQNIDGLHQAAGSEKVWELHGSVHRNYCMDCGKFHGPEAIFPSALQAAETAADPVPRCTCGGILKPDVVLYEEPLDDAVVNGAVKAIREADVLMVAGTSLTVYPAAGLLRYFRGDALVLINRDATAMDDQATLCIHESVGQVLDAAADVHGES